MIDRMMAKMMIMDFAIPDIFPCLRKVLIIKLKMMEGFV